MTILYTTERVRQGFLSIDAMTITHSTFSGGEEMTVLREVMQRGHAAAVLLFDASLDSVLLIRQILPGALAAGKDPAPWQIVAGMIDAGEDGISTVVREAQEEAGIDLGEIVHAHTFMPSPGGSSEVVDVYIAAADLRGAGGIFGLESEGENIEAKLFSAQDAIAMLDAGLIFSGPAVVALSHFARTLEDLRWRFLQADEHCSACGQQADREDWDKLEGGSVNHYWRVTCRNPSCGHVDTNDIF